MALISLFNEAFHRGFLVLQSSVVRWRNAASHSACNWMLENVVFANAMERKAMFLGKLEKSAFTLVHC
jgi:hypothetical protein